MRPAFVHTLAAALAVGAGALPAQADAPPSAPAAIPVETISVDALPDFNADDHRAALRAFRASCAAPTSVPRAALPAPAGLAAACLRAAALGAEPDELAARAFFADAFTVRRVSGAAFFTGYYEPLVEGSLIPDATFAAPLYARPPDLVDVPVRESPAGATPDLDPSLTAARRLSDGRLVAMPDRAAIAAGALGGKPDVSVRPLVWLREPVDAFFVEVQGSARVRLPDGTLKRLAYAGRNGYPYTAIGKVLVEALHVPPSAMGMAQLRDWIRANGQGPTEAGTRLMQRDRSVIFFRFDDALPASAGPVGGEGVSLTAGRSLAIDRAAWPYGLPYYVDATLPWRDEARTPFRRLVVGQDTGAAIGGPARGDIFLGTGAAAGQRAGAIGDHGTLYVLWPKEAGTVAHGGGP